MDDLPKDDVARILAYCAQRVPGELADQVRVEARPRGQSVTILEVRPPWRGEGGPDWVEVRIAQLRYNARLARWTLYWSDRNERWHLYEDAHPGKVDDVLTELDADPTGVFWG